ncbi:MAG: hypothetical protein FVQ85_07950 [Planctomycetes bacterium]|nr:hypothetical protein [Planctomycetota bacterium]
MVVDPGDRVLVLNPDRGSDGNQAKNKNRTSRLGTSVMTIRSEACSFSQNGDNLALRGECMLEKQETTLVLQLVSFRFQARAAYLCTVILMLPAVVLFAWTGSASAGAIDVGSDKQLFVGPWATDGRDEYLVESMRNVAMTMNEAYATGERLMEYDKPWRPGEKGVALQDSGFVLKVGDTFRMYHHERVMGQYSDHGPDPRMHVTTPYIESKDGIHWVKPDPGLWKWKWEGQQKDDLVSTNDLRDYYPELVVWAIFMDPTAKIPEEKFKMALTIKPPTGKAKRRGRLPKGKYGFCSPDGIHWKTKSLKKLGTSGDGPFAPFWDDRIGKYVAYTRIKTMDDPRQVEYFHKEYGKEKLAWHGRLLRVGRSISDDFVNWSKETVVIAPDDIDEANSAPNRVDFYSGPVLRYPGTHNVYIAMLSAFGHWKAMPDPDPDGSGKLIQIPAKVDIQLATSRDGINWHRAPGRKPFIRLGPQGTFWSGMIFTKSPCYRMGDDLVFFFEAFSRNHAEFHHVENERGVGRALLRLDGFISADAAYTSGELTTKPLVFSGSKLELNVATGAGGTVQVEIQDETGKPIDGFAQAEADEITGNYIRVPASWGGTTFKRGRWQGNTDVSSLAGRPIRLRFTMRDCKLYAFQFIE